MLGTAGARESSRAPPALPPAQVLLSSDHHGHGPGGGLPRLPPVPVTWCHTRPSWGCSARVRCPQDVPRARGQAGRGRQHALRGALLPRLLCLHESQRRAMLSSDSPSDTSPCWIPPLLGPATTFAGSPLRALHEHGTCLPRAPTATKAVGEEPPATKGPRLAPYRDHSPIPPLQGGLRLCPQVQSPPSEAVFGPCRQNYPQTR